jgi:hypothetical protein
VSSYEWRLIFVLQALFPKQDITGKLQGFSELSKLSSSERVVNN